jgi:hypothetical protein
MAGGKMVECEVVQPVAKTRASEGRVSLLERRAVWDVRDEMVARCTWICVPSAITSKNLVSWMMDGAAGLQKMLLSLA